MSNKVRIKFGQIEFEAEGDSDLIERERQQFFSLLPTAITAVTPIVSDLSDNKIFSNNSIQEIEDVSSDGFIEQSNMENNDRYQTKYESLVSLIKEKKFNNDTDIVL